MRKPKLLAQTAASNALGAINGSVPQVKQKSVQNMALTIPAAARATPVAQALPAVANMPHANALRDINGKMVNVR